MPATDTPIWDDVDPEKRKALLPQLLADAGQPRDIAARPVEACHQTRLDGIQPELGRHDGDRVGRALRSERRRLAGGDDDVDFEARKFACEFGKLVDVAARIAEFDSDVLAVDIAKIAQALLEITDTSISTGRSAAMSKPTDAIDLRHLLRARSERRAEEATRNSADERSPVHH